MSMYHVIKCRHCCYPVKLFFVYIVLNSVLIVDFFMLMPLRSMYVV